MALLSAAPGLAQGPPQLVVDLNQTPSGTAVSFAAPANGFRYGGHTYFSAFDPQHGVELWRTDGTPAGTALFKDINPGSSSSNPAGFHQHGGILLFAADDGGSGIELWRSDGTVAGTRLVVDINPGPGGSQPIGLGGGTAFLPDSYFSADDGVHGREIWSTDATAAGTALVRDIRPGAASSMAVTTDIVWSIDAVLFAADDGVHGVELWRAGTAGAVLVFDLNPGPGSSMPVRTGAYWSADDGVHGRELFQISSGSATLIADVNPGAGSSNPGRGAYAGSTFVFPATTLTFGRELWGYSLGSGAFQVKDIAPGLQVSSSPELAPQQQPFATRAVFTAADSAGRELWVTDGTAAGTVRIRDIDPGSASSSPHAFLQTDPLSSTYLFCADDGVHGAELWATDGTGRGTYFVHDIHPGSASSDVVPLAAANGQSFLLSATYGPGLSGPWSSDGTSAGTMLLRAIGVFAPGSAPLAITDPAGASYVLHAGDDGVSGRELWRSDGTAAGTVLVKDILPGSGSAGPANLCHWNGKTYFAATDGVHGAELWVTDGTTAGTMMLKDINPGSGFSSPGPFVAFAGALFFAALDANGRELWKTDGTAAGTVLVKDIHAGGGLASSTPGAFLVAAGTLFFTATTAAEGAELWKTDGTTTGTVLVKDVNPGPAGSTTITLASPGHEKAALGSLLIFSVDNGPIERVWRSDGTAAGTVPITSAAFFVPTQVHDLLAWNGRVYYSAEAPFVGREVGFTDGTSNYQLIDLVAGSEGSDPLGLRIVGSRLMFSAWTPAYGRELYRSDGTAAGTVLVKDIYPGPASGAYHAAALPFRFATIAGSTRALFAASDGNSGVELWRTDGTAGGTVLHADINPGAAGSFPEPFTAVLAGNLLLFAAAADPTGRELYAMTSMAMYAAHGVGCPGTGSLVPSLAPLGGAPRIGDPSFGLRLTDSRPSAPTAALIGFGYLRLPLGGGCEANFNLLLPYVPLIGFSDARGSSTFAVPVPRDQGLIGLPLFAQGLAVDSGGAYRGALAFSPGLKMVVGD